MEENVKRKRNHGPNFLAKLRGHKIDVICNNFELEGVVLKGYNRYEILLEDKEGKHILLMKHAIQLISPFGEVDPLVEEKKEEGENRG